MKTRRYHISLGLVLVLAMSTGCASKSKKGDEFDVIPSSSDAGTDFAPGEGSEFSSSFGADGGFEEGKKKGKKGRKKGAKATLAPLGATTPGNYTVQKGDTLMKIAFDIYGDVMRWQTIYDANRDRIQDPNKVPSGISLKVDKPEQPVAVDKNGERYMIQKGDTLAKISTSIYGTPKKWKQIYENNRQLIQDPNRIFAGFYLYYSGEGAVRQLSSGQAAPGASAAPEAPSAPLDAPVMPDTSMTPPADVPPPSN